MKNLYCCVLLLATGLAAANVQASPIWTVTSSGTISEGYDCVERDSCVPLFGTTEPDLAGYKYTISITASIDPAKWSDHVVAPNGWSHLLGDGPGFSTTITVNGTTIKFDVPNHSFGQQLVYGTFTPGGWTIGQSGYNSGRTVEDHYVMASDSMFESWGGKREGYHEVFFRGDIESRSIVLGEIPEPLSLSLFGLGLVGLLSGRLAGKKNS